MVVLLGGLSRAPVPRRMQWSVAVAAIGSRRCRSRDHRPCSRVIEVKPVNTLAKPFTVFFVVAGVAVAVPSGSA